MSYGRCPVCGRDKYRDGILREIQPCTTCGQDMCIVCWHKHYNGGNYACRKEARPGKRRG